MTKDRVDYNISLIPAYTDEQLIHLWKCAISNPNLSERKLLEPFITAIDKERNSRQKASHALLPKT